MQYISILLTLENRVFRRTLIKEQMITAIIQYELRLLCCGSAKYYIRPPFSSFRLHSNSGALRKYCTPTRRKAVSGIYLLLRHLLGLRRWIGLILTLYRQFKKHALSCMLFPVWRDLLLLLALHYEQFYHSYHGRLAR